MKKGCDLPSFYNFQYDTCNEACGNQGIFFLIIQSHLLIVKLSSLPLKLYSYIYLLQGSLANELPVNHDVIDEDYQGDQPISDDDITYPDEGMK